MLTNLFFYLRLAGLCLRLISNLVVFTLLFVFAKLNQQKLLNIILILFIILVWLSNIFLFRQKNTAQIIVEKAYLEEMSQQNNFKTQQFLLNKTELNEKILNQEKLVNQGIKNLQLFLNLANLHSISKNQASVKKYLEQAILINPEIR